MAESLQLQSSSAKSDTESKMSRSRSNSRSRQPDISLSQVNLAEGRSPTYDRPTKDNALKHQVQDEQVGGSVGIENISYEPDQEVSDDGHAGQQADQDRKDGSKNKTEVEVISGVIEFSDYMQKTAEYVRVSHDAKVEDLWKEMKEKWQLKNPHLLISITGGAKQDLSTKPSLKPALKELIRRGLIEVAQSTGAWIITGGTNTGVMKLVGDAIRAHTLKQGSRKQLVAIGIATWGCIKNREKLRSSIRNRIQLKAFLGYQELKKEDTILDPNHTHFILVNDQTENKFGGEIELRAKLENKISEMAACGVKIPIVCIAIEGGKNTIKTVVKAIEANTPVIVVEGSGRAADLLALAYNEYTEPKNDKEKKGGAPNDINQQFWKKLRTNIKDVFAEKDWDSVLGYIEYFLRHRNMITVFPLDGKGNIEHAIIMTLLRAKSEETRTGTLDKIKMALASNRFHIFQEHIYTDETKLTSDELAELAFTAIVNNRLEFLKFFLEEHLHLGDLFKDGKHKIIDFYKKAMKKNKHLEASFKDVVTNGPNLLIKKLVDGLFDPTTPGNAGSADASDAANALFFWAILSRLPAMAVVFLREAEEPFALSLIGHLMLKNLLKTEKDSVFEDELKRQISLFEDLSTGLLTECYSSNKSMTVYLLTRPIPTFDERTAFEIVVHTNNEKILAHDACQQLLNIIWLGKICNEIPSYKKLLRIPPGFLLAPLLLNFREENSAVPSETMSDSAEDSKDQQRFHDFSTALQERRDAVIVRCTLYFKRIFCYLTAPCVKFSLNCASYATFLLLYSIVLLTHFYPTISSAEIVLDVWIVTLICEEIRQLVEGSKADSRKFKSYFSSKWNWMDLTAMAAHLLGFVLRFIPISWCPRCFFAARIVFAFSLMTFYFRILQFLAIFRRLGPKLTMIRQMLIDLLCFMAILMVFVVAYGIATNVILYPNQELRPAIVIEVVRDAWWSVYGQFNIDEVSGDKCEPTYYQTLTADECASLDYDVFNRTVCPGREQKCPANDWLVPILLAIYAVITNVMMISILIAIFSNTFTKVEVAADVVWKIQRYQLLLDYESHPVLPPPLIILEHAYRLIRSNWRKLPYQSWMKGCCVECGDGGEDGDIGATQTKQLTRIFTKKLAGRYEEDLRRWLNANFEKYMLRKSRIEGDSSAIERLAKETNERINQVLRKIEVVDDLQVLLKNQEEKMKQISALLSLVKSRFVSGLNGEDRDQSLE